METLNITTNWQTGNDECSFTFNGNNYFAERTTTSLGTPYNTIYKLQDQEWICVFNECGVNHGVFTTLENAIKGFITKA